MVRRKKFCVFPIGKEGDSIITLEVPRLARSTRQLCDIIDLVKEKHLRLVIIGSITRDCRAGQPDPMSEAFLQMAGVFSQLELAMIRARVCCPAALTAQFRHYYTAVHRYRTAEDRECHRRPHCFYDNSGKTNPPALILSFS